MVDIFDIKTEMESLEAKNKAFEEEMKELDKFKNKDVFEPEDFKTIERCMDALNSMQRLQHIIRISAYHSQKRNLNNG